MLSYLKKISVAESAISKFERLAIVAIFEKHDASQASLLGKAINESQYKQIKDGSTILIIENDGFDTDPQTPQKSLSTSHREFAQTTIQPSVNLRTSVKYTFSLNTATLHDKDYADFDKYLIDNVKEYATLLKNASNRSSDRAMILDWIVEVVAKNAVYIHQLTLFIAVKYFDRYIIKSQNKITLEDLYQLAITTIYIASKQNDIKHLTIEDILEFVTPGRLTRDEIEALETKVLSCLEFRLNIHTHMDLLERIFQIHFQGYEGSILIAVRENALYLLKLSLFDTELLSSDPTALVLSILQIALGMTSKCMKKDQINTQALENTSRTLFSIITLQEIKLVYDRAIDLFTNFQKRLPGLENVNKFRHIYEPILK